MADSGPPPKGRKRRPGRPKKRNLESDDQLDPEQESARVLVQLSQLTRGEDRPTEDKAEVDEGQDRHLSPSKRRKSRYHSDVGDTQAFEPANRLQTNSRADGPSNGMSADVAEHTAASGSRSTATSAVQTARQRQSRQKSVTPDNDGLAGLPSYSAAQRSQARTEASDPPSTVTRGKKRKSDRNGITSSQSHVIDSMKSAGKPGNGPDPTIDPVLQNIDVLVSSPRRSRSSRANTARNDAMGASASRPIEVQGSEYNPFIQEPTEEGFPYYSPYANQGQKDGEGDYEPDQDGSPASVEVRLQREWEAIGTSQEDGHGPKAVKRPVGRPRVHKDHQKPPRKVRNDRFNAKEIAALEQYRDQWCAEHQKSPSDFNSLIQSNMRSNKQASAVYNDLQDMFQYYTRAYLQRFCRRRFHNFSARGVWTPEDDEMLRQTVEEKGPSWKVVGETIGRFHEDCRDRWRNYLVHGNNRNREQWTEAEIINLAASILDCMEQMRIERRERHVEKHGPLAPMSEEDKKAADPAVDTSLVNWQTVSERMGEHGGSRSRLQCSFKWNRLKVPVRQHYLDEARAGGADVEAIQHHPSLTSTKVSDWRIKHATRKVKHMRGGDRYDLLQAILHTGVPSEGNIPWKGLGTHQHLRHWTTTERKAAWLMMKQQLPNNESMDYRNIIYALLPDLLREGVDDHWDPRGWDQTQDWQHTSASQPEAPWDSNKSHNNDDHPTSAQPPRKQVATKSKHKSAKPDERRKKSRRMGDGAVVGQVVGQELAQEILKLAHL